jgi:RHH-type transcriptional regulator, proline utilization regulon repressor / proline dehydrogenase / delta 1-pyrroline-5-carboxylate dehydrogenase
MSLASLRSQIRHATHMDEHLCVEQLLAKNSLSVPVQQQILQMARDLVQQCRQQHHNEGNLEAFLHEFELSNNEGVALMCLAEALLRIPDETTADKLIAEKIQGGDWGSHLGHSDSLFVNASIWGLMLTGKVLPLEPDITGDTQGWLKNLATRWGEPVIRKAIRQAMQIMGNQYVLGSSIGQALSDNTENDNNSTIGQQPSSEATPDTASKIRPNNRFSFDMLGEGTRTEKDAKRYFESYAEAIETIGQHNTFNDVYAANGISVKLSALYPRYEYAQRHGVLSVLLPRIRKLALAARQHNIGLSIDAEEAHRLDLSLDVFEALARDSELSDWQGLGFVLQAYQKRAPLVAHWLVQLAKETHHCLMVRLVKGAYWDTEIKIAQEQGMPDYPVFTRKVNTDLCYQYCAQILLAAPETIYPQFATHNAHTLSTILAISKDSHFEFQRLHGMGELLYQTLHQYLQQHQQQTPPVRTYAPIGQHRELLPYLVRRLLENGANSSFVNQFLDEETPLEVLLQNIESQVTAISPHRHEHIPTPPNLYFHGDEARQNSLSIDLHNPLSIETLLGHLSTAQKQSYVGHSIVRGHAIGIDQIEGIQRTEEFLPITSPTNHDQIVGHCIHANAEDIEQAIRFADAAQPNWNDLGGTKRGALLNKVADTMEQQMSALMALIISEAGRTIKDALAEVREAIDFCRYYAVQAEKHFSNPITLPGPTGEQSQLSLHGRGVFLCISPWNFPLAIFTGQIAAALAAGNTVVAKPAKSTPLVATLAVQIFHQSGIPADTLQLIIGSSDFTSKLMLTNNKISGVVFTGATETAKQIQQQLAQRPGPILPLIAETGGQNVMVVDSTALPEQLVDDVIQSAFLSAGQRCSSLRVLYLQQEIADDILTMLVGALQSYQVGNPAKLCIDIGPVIDQKAQQILLCHIEKMKKEGRLITRLTLSEEHQSGYFVAPHIFEIDTLEQLPREVFGPILHVIRYNTNEIDEVIKQINDSGYGLTLGVHSRIQSFADYIFNHTRVGNTYINRNMVGAVVGTHPFGGCGLSGTGPKAGGPHYLFRFATEKTRTENITARGGNTTLLRLTES